MTVVPVLEHADAEGCLKGYLGGLGLAVYFDVPAKARFPIVVLRRFAGARDPNVGLDYPSIQFDCWGTNKLMAYQCATAVEAACLAAEGATLMSPPTGDGPGAVCVGARTVSGPIWRPDVAAQKARYLLDVAFTFRPA